MVVGDLLKKELKKISVEKLKVGVSAWANSFAGDYLDLINLFRSKEIYIYGSGRFGSGGAWYLNHAGIKPTYFIDSNVSKKENLTVRGIPVVGLSETTNQLDDSIVIIMIGDLIEAEKVKNKLVEKGVKNIYIRDPKNDFVEQLFFWEIAQNIVNNSSWDEFVKGVDDNSIIKAFDLLEDNVSKKAYLTFIKVMCEGEYEPEKYDEDYMAHDVPLAKGYNRFIDAGAYCGENGLAINKKFGPLESVAFIEPDSSNMRELKKRIEKSDLSSKSLFFECALWNENTTLKFNNVASVGSHLSDVGGSIVECFSIDSILRDFKPTMIKMDVEKAEYNALIGSKNVIFESKPDLLISVYHTVDDIWRIILLINSWGLGYKFYLRHHNPWAVDTVLYAVCAE